jgi:predicted lipoprotein
MKKNIQSSKQKKFMALSAVLFTLLQSGCATMQPVVMHADKLAVNTKKTDRAIEICVETADREVGRNGLHAATVGQKLGKTAAVEFADAAADTAVRKGKDVLRRASGAAAGGVAGVATKLLFEWNEPDKVHQRYVEHCLEKRGHRVLGWR